MTQSEVLQRLYYYIPASVRGLPGRGLEQPGPVEGVPAVAGGIDELQGPFRPSPGWDSRSQTRHALPHPSLQPGLAEPSMSRRTKFSVKVEGLSRGLVSEGRLGESGNAPPPTPCPQQRQRWVITLFCILNKKIYTGDKSYIIPVYGIIKKIIIFITAILNSIKKKKIKPVTPV